MNARLEAATRAAKLIELEARFDELLAEFAAIAPHLDDLGHEDDGPLVARLARLSVAIAIAASASAAVVAYITTRRVAIERVRNTIDRALYKRNHALVYDDPAKGKYANDDDRPAAA